MDKTSGQAFCTDHMKVVIVLGFGCDSPHARSHKSEQKRISFTLQENLNHQSNFDICGKIRTSTGGVKFVFAVPLGPWSILTCSVVFAKNLGWINAFVCFHAWTFPSQNFKESKSIWNSLGSVLLTVKEVQTGVTCNCFGAHSPSTFLGSNPVILFPWIFPRSSSSVESGNHNQNHKMVLGAPMVSDSTRTLIYPPPVCYPHHQSANPHSPFLDVAFPQAKSLSLFHCFGIMEESNSNHTIDTCPCSQFIPAITGASCVHVFEKIIPRKILSRIITELWMKQNWNSF